MAREPQRYLQDCFQYGNARSQLSFLGRYILHEYHFLSTIQRCYIHRVVFCFNTFYEL